MVVEDSSLWLAAVFAVISLLLFYLAIAKEAKGNYFTGGFFLVSAILCLRKTRFVFDATQRMVRWNSLLYLKASSGQIPFDDITGIGLETTMGSDAENPNCRLTVLTRQGPVPLALSYSGGSEHCGSLRQRILLFLQSAGVAVALPIAPTGPPDTTDLEPSIRALLAQGRKIDAIGLLRSTTNIGLAEAKTRIDEMEKGMKQGNSC